MSILSERISQRRRQLNLTQEQLADLAGTTQRQISKYEVGKNEPSSSVLMALATSLETTSDWLLGLTQKPERAVTTMSELDDMERQVIEIMRKKRAADREKFIDIIKVI